MGRRRKKTNSYELEINRLGDKRNDDEAYCRSEWKRYYYCS